MRIVVLATMLAVGLAGSRSRGAAPVTGASAPEEALASLRLGARLPPRLRCSKARIGKMETTHEFRVAGRDQYLFVTTECPKDACASEDEQAISGIVVASLPKLAPICDRKAPLSLATAKGLRLGDSLERARTLYGEPQRVFRKDGASTRFHYAGHSDHLGDLGPHEGINMGFWLTFDEGKVASMELFVDTDPHEDGDP
jgi:hypothetical protein